MATSTSLPVRQFTTQPSDTVIDRMVTGLRVVLVMATSISLPVSLIPIGLQMDLSAWFDQDFDALLHSATVHLVHVPELTPPLTHGC